MAIEIKNTDILYYPVPKVATTSLKHFCYELNHGHGFSTDPSKGENFHIHNHSESYEAVELRYIDKEASLEKRRVTVVRDPIERILSAYSNRVVSKGVLSQESIDLRLAGMLEIPTDPSLEVFIENLEKYRLLSPVIRHHTEPHSTFLGHDLRYFQLVFPFEDVAGFVEIVNRAAGTSIQLRHLQKSTGTRYQEVLNNALLEKLLEFCSGDYALLRQFYSPPKSINHCVRGVTLPTRFDAGSTTAALLPKRPFIIWTLQRSGGTNVASHFFDRSYNRSLEHEPLNLDRELGYIRDKWESRQNLEMLRQDLREELSKKVNIKHCVDVVPSPVTSALLDVSCELGYKHLFLIRRTALDRLLSLHFARSFNIWGWEVANSVDSSVISARMRESDLPIEDLITHEQNCRSELSRIFDSLVNRGATPAIAVFEDLYNTFEQDIALLLYEKISTHLDLMPSPDVATIRQLLFKDRSEPRVNYNEFRNYDALELATRQLGSFELGGTIPPLPAESISIPEGAVAQMFQPVRSWRSDLVKIGGVGLDPTDPKATWQVESNGVVFETISGLRSERFEKSHPDLIAAGAARFAALDVPLAELDQVRVSLANVS